jgi:AraC-like DNA-binding protein
MGNIKVGQLADKIGWSSRHLNRQFRLHTGLNIKAFAQTIRMQHVCKQLYSSPGTTLNIAHELGFFDQAHLINDFKKRLFINPSSFFNQFMSDFYNP